MKRYLFTLCLLSTMFVGVKAQNLSEVINDKESIVIDVRSPEEFGKGSAKNAVNIPLEDLEKSIFKLKVKKNVVLYCRSGNRAGKAEQLLKNKGLKNVHNAKTLDNVVHLTKSNLQDSKNYNKEKPHFNILRDSEKLKQVAVSLGKDVVFKKHKTSTPASLVVLKGEVKFIINDQEIILKPYDYYDIPVDVEHELIGLQKENLFVVFKQK